MRESLKENVKQSKVEPDYLKDAEIFSIVENRTTLMRALFHDRICKGRKKLNKNLVEFNSDLQHSGVVESFTNDVVKYNVSVETGNVFCSCKDFTKNGRKVPCKYFLFFSPNIQVPVHS